MALVMCDFLNSRQMTDKGEVLVLNEKNPSLPSCFASQVAFYFLNALRKSICIFKESLLSGLQFQNLKY